MTPDGSAVHLADKLEWSDGLFDVTWSEGHEGHLITCSGDGSLQLWDLGLRARGVRGPARVYREHSKEIYSVEWSQTRGEALFVSGSWDASCKLWDPHSPRALATFQEHTGVVYAVACAPHRPSGFASVGGDGMLKIWDGRSPVSAASILAHEYEALAVDWAKYDEHLVVTGSVDKSLRAFDLRTGRAVSVMYGHEYGIRRLRCSPHARSVVASCGYDFSVRIWDMSLPAGHQQVALYEDHAEFVVGLDFSLHVPGLLADCAWDERAVLRHTPLPPRPL
jgi:peroxin-7